jgi:hypothetical protein
MNEYVSLVQEAISKGIAGEELQKIIDFSERSQANKVGRQIDIDLLKAPFPPENIEWRVQRSGLTNGNPWAFVLAYIDNRAILNRLDSVCGVANWKNEFKTGPDGGILCGISIRCDGEWVTKWDGAENTDIEAIKGGLSNSMKRAANQFGIGRYLYDLEGTFANIHPKGEKQGVAIDKKNNNKKVYFKWDPPLLPMWAIPSEGKNNNRKIKSSQVDYYPQVSFEKNMPNWAAMVLEGKATVDKIINKINSTGSTFTEEQLKSLNGITENIK